MNTSYTYSNLRGNYSGLTSSDENGRNSPSVNRFFDGLYMSFDAHGDPIDGLLQTDRPHYFKFQGTYDLPWGTMLGMEYRAASGTVQQARSPTRAFRSSMPRAPTSAARRSIRRRT